jgi:hypothetical protein
MKHQSKAPRAPLPAILALVGLSCTQAHADVPTYDVEIIAPFTSTTTVLGASEAGHLVGWQTQDGQVRGYVARAGAGLTLLPLPAGYASSAAMDVNSAGVVVGAVAVGGFPFDGGEPAIWTPDGSGGYVVHIPEQFQTLPSPIGTLSINGGMAVAINESGTVVGWSRYQGFQGGPSTQFSINAPPENLAALGFNERAEDINARGVVVGGGQTLDLNSGVVTDLGIPASLNGVGFTMVLGYAINDDGQVIAAAARATSGNEVWMTYRHEPDSGWSPVNPSQIPTRFVGLTYDNNSAGDISAAGGIYFAAEDHLAFGYSNLLDPAYTDWTVAIGYMSNDRSVYATALNTATGESALVALIPQAGTCDADVNGDGSLNFFDVSGFLDLYNTGDPAADLSAPFGELNFFDVSAYLAAYNAGCP